MQICQPNIELIDWIDSVSTKSCQTKIDSVDRIFITICPFFAIENGIIPSANWCFDWNVLYQNQKSIFVSQNFPFPLHHFCKRKQNSSICNDWLIFRCEVQHPFPYMRYMIIYAKQIHVKIIQELILKLSKHSYNAFVCLNSCQQQNNECATYM